ncbi:MAG: ribonuclease T2 [Planctomycetes bacterium]|nr:ribonuclease T2 [Planctomycetota bacterium]
MSSKRKTKQFNRKRYSWIIIVLSIVILALNAFFSQQGDPLPEEITDAAETVLQESLQGGTPVTDVGDRVTATPPPHAVVVDTTSTPVPVVASLVAPDFDNPAAEFDYYVLALSWEPAFCETHPEKLECALQTETRFDATHFVLHGLWPNRNNDPNHTFSYCDVSQNQIRLDKGGDWCDLPGLELSTDVTQRLDETMPGKQSCLQNHEWYKHGTCSGLSAEAYYDVSTRLVQSFAQTNFDRYIAVNVGQTVDRSAVLEQFAVEFGAGAQDYLSLRCDEVDGVDVLTEIRITLKKELSTLDDWSLLFPANPPHIDGSCPGQFKIDAVGLGNL